MVLTCCGFRNLKFVILCVLLTYSHHSIISRFIPSAYVFISPDDVAKYPDINAVSFTRVFSSSLRSLLVVLIPGI